MENRRLFNYVDEDYAKQMVKLSVTSETENSIPEITKVRSYHVFKGAATGLLIVALIWQTFTYGNISPLISGVGYVISGLGLIILFSKHSDTRATFLLSFAVCNIVAAIAQSYSLATFATPASTLDANTFLKLISSRIDMNLEAMKTIVNAPLAVALWQGLNSIWAKFGISGGLWIAVQFNALLVACSAATAQELAKLLLGNNNSRLHYGVFLFSLCGMHILFGSILIRDSFALFFNIIALYAMAKFLLSPTLASFIQALLINTVCGVAMYFIREQSIYLYLVFFLVAMGVSLLNGKASMGRLATLCLVGAIMVVGSVEMASTWKSASEETGQKSESYSGGSLATNREGSLGVSLIVNQPAPIKAVAGSLYLFVQPIPLWGYFQQGLDEYLWIKGYQGLFTVVIFPSLILGTLLCMRRTANDDGKTALGRYLVLYLGLSTALVALTSLETRHHGQFFPAYLVIALAGMQPTGNHITTLSWIRIIWFTAIIAGHIAWWMLRL